LDVLRGRRDCNAGLQKLVIQSCRVHKDEYRSKLKELVKKVKWENVKVVRLDYRETDDDTDDLEDECEIYSCPSYRF